MQLIDMFLRIMFVIDLLFVGCLLLIHFRRRKGFKYKFPISLVVCLLLAYFEPALTGLIFEHGLPVALIDTVFQVSIVTAVFAVCWDLDFKKFIFSSL